MVQQSIPSASPRKSNLVSHALVFIWDKKIPVISAACILLYAGFLLLGLDKVMFPDEKQYLSFAETLVHTGVYGYQPGVSSAIRTPGYILFVALPVAVGLGKLGVVLLQVVLWGGCIYLAGLISHRLR